MEMDQCNLMKHRDGVGENEYVITLSNLRAQRTFDHFVKSQRREEKKRCEVKGQALVLCLTYGLNKMWYEFLFIQLNLNTVCQGSTMTHVYVLWANSCE